jgi:hypothetical protein
MLGQNLQSVVVMLTDISQWLGAVGFNYDSLVPSIRFDGSIRQSQDDFDLQQQQQQQQQQEVTSAFRCAFDRDAQIFSPSSRLVAQSSVAALISCSEDHTADYVASSLAILPYAFGSGVKATLDNSRLVSIDVPGSQASAVGLSQLAAVLLNGSRAVGISYVLENGRSVDYYVKEVTGLDRVDEDLRLVGLNSQTGGELEEGGVNVTVVRRGQRRHQNHRGEHVDVIVTGRHVTVHVRYMEPVTDPGDRQNWVTRTAEERAVDAAWDEARQQVAETDGTRRQAFKYEWNRTQREQLLSNGRVPGVVVKYIRSHGTWPEFADDPTNVRFVVDDEDPVIEGKRR